MLSLAGFGKAAKFCKKKSKIEVKTIRDEFENILLKNSPEIVIIGKDSERLPNTILFSLPGIKSESLLIALDIEGFDVSTGAACSSGQVEPSSTLKTMGLSDRLINSCIRISLGSYNSIDEVYRFSKTLIKIKERFLEKVK